MKFPMDKQENQSVDQDPPQEVEETIDSTTKEDSGSSTSSSTITDLMEDDASSPVNGPLYELSDLMAHLPIKRGLSKYYDGKSKKFTSMDNVKSLEDLAKKGKPSFKKRKKTCKRNWSPNPTIAKKAASRSSFLSTMVGRNGI